MKKCLSIPGMPPVLLMLAMFMTGCAGIGVDNRPPEEIVAERAQAWANALLAGDLEGAYKYTSPNYRKFATSGRYHARVEGTSRWDVADVDSVSCEPEACTVVYWVEYKIPHMKIDVRRPMEYRWVKTEGSWWLYVSPR